MPPVKQSITIYQGTTQRIPFVRRYIGYAVEGNDCDGYTSVCTGEPVPETDWVQEDYTDCIAHMQLRADIESADVLWTMSTEDGRIELDGNKLTLVFLPEESSLFEFDSAVGQVEITRPTGEVERQYEFKFKVSKEGTRWVVEP